MIIRVISKDSTDAKIKSLILDTNFVEVYEDSIVVRVEDLYYTLTDLEKPVWPDSYEPVNTEVVASELQANANITLRANWTWCKQVFTTEPK